MNFEKLSKEEVWKLSNAAEYAKFVCEGKDNFENALICVHANIQGQYKDFPLELMRRYFKQALEAYMAGELVAKEKPKKYFQEEEEELEKDATTPSKPDRKSIDDFSMGACFMDDPPETEWLVKNLIEKGTMNGLVAPGGAGKTWLALDLAMNLASGKNGHFLGSTVDQQCLVFFVTVEDGLKPIHRRIKALDNEGHIRQKTQETFFALTAIETFGGHFTLVENGANQNAKFTFNYKWLIEEIEGKCEEYPDLPVFIIFDTYSATHHGDENTTTGAKEWFRAATVLQEKFEATILVTHHIRKTGHQETLRTPGDFEMAIRGSNVFTNSCRAVFGVWPLPASEAKKIKTLKGRDVYNFSLIKDNNGPDWGDKDIQKFNRPTMTLVRHQDGYLYYDPQVNAERKSICETKKALSEEEQNDLQNTLKEIIYFCASAGYPLSKSMFDKQDGYTSLMPKQYKNTPPRYMKTALESLLNENKIVIANIFINNKECEVYDKHDGDYASNRKNRPNNS